MAKYSFEFKKKVVLKYLSGADEIPYLSKKHSIKSDSQFQKQVNEFKAACPDALRLKKKEQKILNSKNINKISLLTKNKTINTDAEHVKEPEDGLLKLQIENAFLKESRRLYLEDKAKILEIHA